MPQRDADIPCELMTDLQLAAWLREEAPWAMQHAFRDVGHGTRKIEALRDLMDHMTEAARRLEMAAARKAADAVHVVGAKR